MENPSAVDRYIASSSTSARPKLKALRDVVKKEAPRAEEAISYGLPGYKLLGKPLVYFGAWKTHIGFYATPSGNAAFKKELAKYDVAKGSIRFPIDKPLPLGLIRKMVRMRVKENMARVRTGTKKTAFAKKGMHIQYYTDGSLMAKGPLKAGKPHGRWQWWRKDGTKMRSGVFDMGEKIDTWITYDQKGKPYKVTKMR